MLGWTLLVTMMIGPLLCAVAMRHVRIPRAAE
jgi:hypothetical protein